MQIRFSGLACANQFYVFSSKTLKLYAEKVLANTDPDKTPTLVLSVRNFKMINDGQPGTLTVRPMLISEVADDFYGTTITYNVNAQ